MGRGDQEFARAGREGKSKEWKKNYRQIYSVHVPTPQDKCNHYALQRHTNKKENWKQTHKHMIKNAAKYAQFRQWEYRYTLSESFNFVFLKMSQRCYKHFNAIISNNKIY